MHWWAYVFGLWKISNVLQNTWLLAYFSQQLNMNWGVNVTKWQRISIIWLRLLLEMIDPYWKHLVKLCRSTQVSSSRGLSDANASWDWRNAALDSLAVCTLSLSFPSISLSGPGVDSTPSVSWRLKKKVIQQTITN